MKGAKVSVARLFEDRQRTSRSVAPLQYVNSWSLSRSTEGELTGCWAEGTLR